MSVDLHEEAGGRILVTKLTGKLTKEDYEHFMPEVERRIKQHGKLRMLVDMHNFHGWTAGALWHDVKFDLKHFRDIERLALVGEKTWEHGMAVFCKPFSTATIRYFDRSEAEQADAWIQAELPAASDTASHSA
ncbi:MAG TPA: STAS/SEC14 domain-containing protein [Pirellulales bacterium]|nr:STAS/SEC14 domain-containing protein [Pirellulales bacterium]